MLLVELEAEDLAKNGGFVKIGRVARAIAKANGAANVLDAERKIFPRINAAVQLGKLIPLHSENLTPLPKDDYGLGIVPFAELAAWGRAAKLFDFKLGGAIEGKNPTPDADLKPRGGRPKSIHKKAKALRHIIEQFQKTAKQQFDSGNLPGSAADLLEACRRMEKAVTKKCSVFSPSEGAFKSWLRAAGYGFLPGRTPDAEDRFWTRLCVETIPLITPEIFSEVYDVNTL